MCKRDQDSGYEDWLKETDHEDTELNRGWYECPEEERYEYIQEHEDWWEDL